VTTRVVISDTRVVRTETRPVITETRAVLSMNWGCDFSPLGL
jgi:hypothetical protein